MWQPYKLLPKEIEPEMGRETAYLSLFKITTQIRFVYLEL